MSEIKFNLIKQFGPSVFKAIIPTEIVNKLNKNIDEIIKDKDKSSKLDLGKKLAGDVTQEFNLEPEFIKSSGWLDFLVSCVKKWIELETGQSITKFNVQNSWVVRQFENEYNPIHYHSGHVSGAGFLKVPSSLGTHTQKSKSNQVNYLGGNLQLINGSKMFLSHSTIDIEPKVGEMYFFPAYLMHCVYPFKNSNEERRSISFNASLDENIFNVYGKN